MLPARLIGAAAVAAVTLTGCGPTTAPAPPAVPTSATTTAAPASTTPSSSTHEPSAATSAPPLATDAHGYTITSITEPGSQPDKSVTIPQLSGGDPAVTARFNAAMQASRAGMPAQSADMSVDDGELPGGFGSGVTRIGSGVVAGRMVLLWYGKGAAHPNHSLGTVVIATHTATPVTVDDLYQDRAAAQARLRTLLPQLDTSGRLNESSVSGEDIDTNWLPTSSGLEVYVSVAHVMGDYVVVTVPWDQIADQLRPGMLDALRAD
ncbi:hypothetical protein ACPCIR_06645 [Mycobacterium sp. NPDC051198]